MKPTSAPSNVGHAIGGTFWITDVSDHNRLTPIGCVGELLIAGRIVAREYLNDKEKTDASFVSNPAWAAGSSIPKRFYKTGDLARFNPDGTASILGRKDAQVKLRGQRIELGEIEYHINRVLGMTDGVVELIKPTDKPENAFIAAFLPGLESNSDNLLLEMSESLLDSLSQLEAELTAVLPSYMVPSVYLPIREMALTANGKRDKRVLHSIALGLSNEQRALYGLSGQSGKQAPSTPVEKKLQALWMAALGFDSSTAIGVSDNFFRLGGDSIAAMRLVALAREQQILLRVADVFTHPRLSDMAANCTSLDGEHTNVEEVIKPFTLLPRFKSVSNQLTDFAEQCELATDLIQDAYPCTALQEGLLSLSLKQPGSYIASNVFRVPKTVSIEKFKNAWEQVVEATDILRTRIVYSQSSGCFQVVVRENINWETAPSVEEFLTADMESFVRYGGPLARYALIPQSNDGVEELYFVWVAHHAIYDGGSMQLVLQSVMETYMTGNTPAPSPFNGFIKYVQSIDQYEQDNYWRNEFKGANPLSFPVASTFNLAPREEQLLLRKVKLAPVASRSEITMSSVVRAAWAVVAGLYSETTDVVFGAVLTGRNVPIKGMDRLIGPTVTTVPIRIKVDPTEPCVDFLSRVQLQSAEAMPFEHTGLQNIRRLGVDEKAACEFGTLLTVQPTARESENETNPIGLERVYQEQSDFHTYPLALGCYLETQEVEIEAYYDSNIISPEQMDRVLVQFEQVIIQLHNGSVLTVKDLGLLTSDDKKVRDSMKALLSDLLKQYQLEQVVEVNRRPPSSKIEIKLQQLWAGVLDVTPETISAGDSFLQLGGDSIGAMKLVSEARKQGITLSVGDIFRHPQLEKMAEVAHMKPEQSQQSTQKPPTELISSEPVAPFSLLKGFEDKNMFEIIMELSAKCEVNPAHLQDAYPTTALQEGLFALSVKQTGAYMAQNIFRLPRRIDLNKFQKAWEVVLKATDILRTRIVDIDGSHLQIVLKEAVEWQTATNLKEYLTQDLETPITYGGSLVRFAIVDDADAKDRYFVWSAHHAIYDGGSLPIIMEKVAQAYDGMAISNSPAFNVFVKYLNSIEKQDSDNYWRQELANARGCSFPATSSPNLVRQEQTFRRLIQLQGQKSNATFTMSTLIQAAWGVVVGRYANTTDTVFGVTLAGRNAPIVNMDSIVGPTITTVPFRVTYDESQSVAEFLEALQIKAADMIPHEHTGLQNIRRLGSEIQPALDFNNLLVVQPAVRSNDEAPLDGIWNLERIDLAQSSFHTYPLVVECNLIDGSSMEVEMLYDESVISAQTVKRLSAHFNQVIQQLFSASASQRTLDTINMFSVEDQADLLAWNEAIHTKTMDTCVHEVFKQQAAQTPDAEAICSWDAKLTYREVDELSEQLAHRLVSAGVGPEVLVPHCFDKSAWTAVSLMAIMKAGGACVGLDPAHPKKRIEDIVTRAQARVVVASPRHCHLFEGLVDHIIPVDAGSFSRSVQPIARVPSRASSTNPVFVLFTSGSTGTPKGIVIEHGSLCTSSEAHGSRWHIGPGTRLFQFAAHTFDVSVADMCTSLMRGATICVPSDAARSNNLAGAMKEMNVNWTFLTPTVARLIRPAEVPCLKTLVLGGEPSTMENLRTWANDVELIICYGPAETSIYCAGSTPAVLGKSEPSNVGTAIGGKFWVVEPDNHEKLTPVGCVGELLIEGRIVAREYLNEKEKTNAAFIIDPLWRKNFGGVTGCKLYKTGDLAKFNEDGTLSILGRKDSQIKIRGQRVELGEIEFHIMAQLRSIGAKDTVVELIKPDGKPDAAYLAAFIVGLGDTSSKGFMVPISASLKTRLLKLEEFLADTLPSYMVPTLFIPLARLPLTTNGKRDRRQLQSFISDMSAEQLAQYRLSDGAKQAAASDTEVALQSLWAEVLDVPSSSITASDNFFRLGGDSISAMRLVRSARGQSITLTVALIFQHPKLTDLAHAIEHAEDVPTINGAYTPFSLVKGEGEIDQLLDAVALQCSIDKASIQDIYPCTAIQEGMLALSSRQTGAYIAQHVFRLSLASNEANRFRHAWMETIRRTEILRTRIVYIHDQGLGSLQVVVDDAPVWEEASTLNGYLSQSRNTSMTYGSQLSRYALVTEGDERFFVWTAHHALYDGGSIPMILDHVQQFFKGEEITPAPPFTSFISYLDSVDPIIRDDYWKNQLAACSISTFPLPRTLATQKKTRVEKSLLHGMGFIQNENAVFTKSAIIRAAWAIVISQYTGSDDIVFGATLAGRNAPVLEMERIIGPTITTVPIRVQLESTRTVVDLLNGLQNQATEMIPFEHSGLQNIRKLNADTQVACNFQNLLVIQPKVSSESDGSNDAILFEQVNIGQEDFHTYPLVVECNLSEDRIVFETHYDMNAIPTQQVQRIAYQLEHIINQLNSASDGITLAELDLFCPQDRQQIMIWNHDEPEASEACVHNIVEEQAIVRPSALAVDAWDAKFTYHQLDLLASRLAHHLSTKGVHQEVLVPVCFDKSAWTVVVMLAILKAGGACVPLNPAHPITRHQIILDNTKAKVVITAPEYEERFKSVVACVVAVDAKLLQALPDISASPSPTVNPGNAAFVVFTSGSTGTPKGIVLEHRALCTSAREHGAIMRVRPTSRVLQFAAYTFDVSIGEMFTTLMFGGCVCVPSESQRLDVAASINAMQVNWAYLTPTVASLLHPSETPTLRTLSMGGEAVKQEALSLWADQVYLINIYGPAETTIWSTALPSLQTSDSAATIGRGVGSLSWVVDPSNHNILCPIGSTGELLIEGPILARGYLNDPKKTAAAFIENPDWIKQEGRTRRFYKTGDLVRYNNDGTLDFMGRKDTQVKLFGQRIELGEIEHHLKQELGKLNLNEVAVEMCKSSHRSAGAELLAAFFSGPGAVPSDAVIDNEDSVAFAIPKAMHESLVQANAALSGILPSYMIPSLYVPMTRLPQTVSGKTDRKELRRLVAELSQEEFSGFALAARQYQPVSTSKEKALQSLWMHVLGLPEDTIGANHNFFQLGGDSIGAMKLVAAARSKGFEIGVPEIFTHPVLSQMAAVLRTGSGEDDSVEVLEPFALIGDIVNLQEHIEQAASQCELDVSSVLDMYPCTALQEGLLALSVKEPGTYMAQNVFKLPQSIDEERFRDAWNTAVKTIDILRTRVIYSPILHSMQVVTNDSIEWLSGTSLEDYLETDRKTPVNYGSRLSRYAIIHQQDGNYFAWTIHHAQYDGTSLAMILQRVADAYEHKASAEDRLCFNSFIKYLMETDAEERDEFWRAQLKDASPAVFPPQSTSSRQNRLSMSKEIKLSENSGHANITRSNLIKAAWALILSKYSETESVTFGLTVAGRNASISGMSKIVGPMITTVPVHVPVNCNRSILQFLEDIQLQSAHMMPYEHTGLQNIRQLGNGPKAACDLRNLLVIQPRAAAEETFSSSSLGLEAVNNSQTDFHTYPLVLECNLDESSVEIEAQYDANSIHPSQMESILSQFEQTISQLMEKLSSHAEDALSEVDMISAADKAKLVQWNHEHETVNACVHDLVSQEVMRRPNTVAVDGWDTQLTYSELDRLSERLASRLASLGVGPEVFVPFCFDKSSWAIVAMLATLKAGGACVALNPAHPIDRLQDIMKETAARVVLAGRSHAKMFEGIAQVVIVDQASLDDIPDLGGISTPERSPAQPNNPGFVVFTSGSTGKPKGIVLEHRALCSSAKAHGAVLRINANSRVLQFAAYTFDVSIGEIFTTLMAGGTVCVPSEQDRMENLAEAIRKMEINWAYLTPTVASLLQPDEVPTLKTLALGGEAVRPENLRVWADSVYLINIYGPAETTIWSTALAGLTSTTSAGNIGHGVGAKMWLTDPTDPQKLSPVGCVGEILIEGPILARCYLNEPEKTAASFIEMPRWTRDNTLFIAGATRRFYRSGDLGRFNYDGTLEFLGRRDTQVKLRGQRIELGEIEHHICANSNVQQAAVVVPRSGYCESRLVAVVSVVLEKQTIDNDAALQLLTTEEREAAASWMSEVLQTINTKLPSYMIPTTWVLVGRLPLSVSGKLDRKVVKQWVEQMDEETYQRITSSTDEPATEAAANEREGKIQHLWSRVLNLPPHLVTMGHSFLSLGGDSITAMQLVSLFRSENVGKVTVRDILQAQSIPQLAQSMSPLSNTQISVSDPVDTPFDLTPIQQFYFDIAPAANTAFHQALALRITRPVDPQQFKKALRIIVQRHSMLRSRFSLTATSEWQQLISSDITGSFSYRVHNINNLARFTDLAAEGQKLIDIETGPMMSVELFNVENDGQVVFFAAHHLAIDLVSWRILLSDLETILEGKALEKASPFPFQAWSKLQAEYAVEHLAPQKVVPESAQIPAANFQYWRMANQPNTFDDVLHRSFTLDSETTSALLGKSNRALATEPVDIFLAALLFSFGRTFPDRQVPPIYSESHGREPWNSDIDLSSTVGWFTTISPTAVPVKTGDSLYDIIRRVKDTRRQMPTNGWSYFTSRYLNSDGIEAFKKHWPMEILFNYQGQYQQLERQDALLRIEDLQTPNLGQDMQRLALFDISVAIVGATAEFSLTYNRHIPVRSRMRDWMDALELALHDAVLSLESRAPEPTLTDFPLMSMTYAELDKMRVSLAGAGISSFDKVEEVYPCSPMQEGILISQQRLPGSYEIHNVAEIRSFVRNQPVSVQRLMSAWQKVVDRHPMLRTVFIKANLGQGLFDQVVLKDTPATILHLKCKDSEALESLEAVSGLAANDVNPPHKLVLCETSSNRIYCKLIISHALTDASSNAILFRDFTIAYGGVSWANPAPRYSNYISFIQNLSINKSIAYWKNYLADAATCSFPVIDGVSPDEGEEKEITLDVGSVSEIRSFSKSHGLTMNSIFLAVWGLVLRCFTGSDDVCFGFLSAGRDAAVDGIQDAVGPFINMMICRVDMSADPALVGLVERVQTDFVNSIQHQHVSLAKIHNSWDFSVRLYSILLFPSRALPENIKPVISQK